MLRVATYNVRSLRDDREALVRVVAAMRPDVLCLQEAPRFAGWRRRRRDLAARLGMTVAAGGRVGGVAVLAGSAVRVLRARSLRLRWYAGLEWRAVALAVVEKDGDRYAVASAHLDLVAGARLRHAVEAVAFLEEAARGSRAWPVLGCDVNERPDGPAWGHLARRYADCFTAAPRGDGRTFPSARPGARIDAVFAGRGLEVLSCGDAGAGPADLAAASDHRPVVAELRPSHAL
ncbi:endonuclease/exonuclease/phosphatase family protein [Microbispora sp. ATCC PTA-5024]|uniref:endonuclease/exonuclease/phosphatase family protein n=1 Tax=Microbispora sp. ATCC PTA-5024 TaxID=316330 RepID=UPI0003DDEB75|nr:endonuclease/exonuclease/phosphatase family protein [Microbispora sp. ATCC PTA-5024]ETK36248.1 hypothetical protein MPTA5024_09825 [Microbispora sp. ATCC PTA-5024]